jgi:acyl carrier protein
MTTDPQILAEVLAMVDDLAGDWEYDGPISPDTFFLAEMGLESLDIVVLGTMIQQRYGRLPFAEWLAQIGERPIAERDVNVAALVSFVAAHRRPVAEEV